MKILKYNDYLVREDGLFLNEKTNEIVSSRKDKYGFSIVNNKSVSMYVKDIMCFLFFEYKMSFSLLIKIDYIKSNEDNSIFNFKLYARKDKYNKSGKYIILGYDYSYLCFDCKKQIGQFNDILEAYKLITT